MEKSVTSTIIPYPTPVADLESEPFKDPASPVASDLDFVKTSFNSELFSDRISPAISAALDPDDEPLSSPDTTNYYGGPRFSKEDPPEDGPIDASRCEIVQGLRKTVRPQHTLPLSTLALINDWMAALPSSPPQSSPPPLPTRSVPSRRSPCSSPSPSIRLPPKSCKVSPTPALPTPTLPFVLVELLLPHKRFTTMERIKTLEREVESLRVRLVATKIQIN
ncbi:hypothetical protein Tco_1574668 [Tanacetum coccineum]